MITTDMAAEFAPQAEREDGDGYSVGHIEIDEVTAIKLNRPRGKYVSFETDIATQGQKSKFAVLSQALCEQLTTLSDGAKKVLVAALGNPNLTADALGSKVFSRLNVTRHISVFECELSAVAPTVTGLTGIESYDIVKAAVDIVRPDVVVAVDALTASEFGRLGRIFQITDVGITPGSGISNHRKRLDRESLGVKTLSIGVPLVVYASTVASDFCKRPIGKTDAIMTPKNIDILVDSCAVIIAGAINRAYSVE